MKIAIEVALYLHKLNILQPNVKGNFRFSRLYGIRYDLKSVIGLRASYNTTNE